MTTFVAFSLQIIGQQPTEASPANTLHATAQLVVLDATVFDKAGKVVTVPLTKDDFEITEEKKPQTIRYFESQSQHLQAQSADPAKAPLIIAILDELNFPYNPAKQNAANIMDQVGEYSYIRQQLSKYLESQPAQLDGPMEMLAFTPHGYLLLCDPTRDRDLILRKLKQRDPGLGSPYRFYEEEGTDHTQTRLSLQAIDSLALRERGIPGRKVVLWLGYGGPNSVEPVKNVQHHVLNRTDIFVRQMTDLLIDARITLYMFSPGIRGASQPILNPISGNSVDLSAPMGSFSFETDFGFDSLVRATGGREFGGNRIDAEISTSTQISAMYYTLSYAPHDLIFDGKFLHISVSVKGHPEWRVTTKAGFYSMRYGGQQDVEHQVHDELTFATYDTMPFSSIGATVVDVARLSDDNPKQGPLASFTLAIQSEDLQWQTNTATGQREAQVAISAVAMNSKPEGIGSKAGIWKLAAPLHFDPDKPLKSLVKIEMPVPPKTVRIRFVVRDVTSGRIGSIDLRADSVTSAQLKTQSTSPKPPSAKVP